MRLLIITQDDPFFLPRNIEYFLNKISSDDEVVAAVVLNVSPFGKKESFAKKALKTLRIFGMRFFVNYALRFVVTKLILKRSVISSFKSNNIEMISPQGSINSTDSLEVLRRFEPDILISIAGNEIYRRPLLDLAKFGCLNLHTGMLPKYRGLMPTFWALKNNEEEIGVTVFQVDEGIDSGPILVQKSINVDGFSLNEVIKKTKRIGMDCMLEAVGKVKRGEADLIDNDATEATYFSFPSKGDVKKFRQLGKKFF